ncbi:MAG TPA: pitrilysin family protein [Burkholderiales bacterium]|nr:pitrilysin family protein [Burkholderiales bacterium]
MIPRRAAIALAAVALATAAHAEPRELTLANGLRLIIKEDHRAPTVVQQVWYRAGSMDESPGTTGVAHVLEHMMFKGTRRVGPEEFSRLVAEAGGRENAFTNTDFTVYHEQVHRDRLPLIMRLEADRMANLAIRPEEFGREIKVVMEERRLSTDDQPRALLDETLLATAFAAHPYKWPTIGWMQDLQNMTWRDAQSWYRSWYAPDNATVVVVGDVDPEQVITWAKRYYGPVARKAVPARKAQSEPQQKGMKRVIVKASAELPFVRLGYKAPALRDPQKDWEPFALAVLVKVLGGNDAARLNQVLVRERRIATSVGADYELISRGPGMVFLNAAAAQGHAGDELEAALREIVAQVASKGISEEELARAKVQLLSQLVFQRDSFFAQAMELGELESSGLSFRDADRIPERYKAVTAQQVQSVAAKYLVDDGLTVALLDPQPLARSAAAHPPAAAH